MDKLKKLLYIPAIYHLAVFVAMIIFSLGNDLDLKIVSVLLMDLCGVVICPMFLAVMGIVHAILNDGKVYDYIYHCLGILGAIGVVRMLVYFALVDDNTLLVAVGALLISLVIYSVWACLFAFTDHMMKKNPRRKSTNQSKNK